MLDILIIFEDHLTLWIAAEYKPCGNIKKLSFPFINPQEIQGETYISSLKGKCYDKIADL